MSVPHPLFAHTLATAYGLLREHFGYARKWWPGSPSEICVCALLVQRCDWTQANIAVRNLAASQFLDMERLAVASTRKVAGIIRNVSFARTKAARLVEWGRRVVRCGHTSLEQYLNSISGAKTLRRELLSLPGVGNETADCILCFATDRFPQFVVDEYCRRVFERLGVLPNRPRFWTESSYEDIQAFVEQHLFSEACLSTLRFPGNLSVSVALARDLHAQVVEVARHHCLKQNPRCDIRGTTGWRDYAFCDDHCSAKTCTRCPLADICNYAQSRSEKERSSKGGPARQQDTTQ